MFDGIISGGNLFLTPEALIFVTVGTIVSVVFGVIPGLSSITAVALLFPFIFGMAPENGIFFMAGLLGTSTIGGAVTAILLNIPGTPINTATLFDGHPMAKKGQAGRAIGIATTASVVGLFFGLSVLVVFLPLVMKIVWILGPPEFFMLIMLGLVTIAFASRGSMIKGLASAGLGVLISLFGFSGVHGVMRFSFGSSEYIWDGLPLIAFFIGLFAISEVIRFGIGGDGTIATGSERIKAGFGGIVEGAIDVFRNLRLTLQSSILGSLIGVLPGVGGIVANFLGYAIGRQTSKHPELWGTGIPEGVVASESGNNAKDGGALIPTLAFGIPGSAEMALLLASFSIMGLAPGPFFIREHPDLVWGLIFGFAASAVIAALIVFISADLLARITTIRVHYLLPVVLVFALVGVYAYRENIWDVGLAIIVGVFGYLLDRFGYSLVTLAIGFVLGNLAEVFFVQAVQISLGDYSIFFTRPASLLLFVLSLLVLILPLIRSWLGKSAEVTS